MTNEHDYDDYDLDYIGNVDDAFDDADEDADYDNRIMITIINNCIVIRCVVIVIHMFR